MIFDDVFSPLDKTTAKHVFTSVFSSEGLLRRAGTTVILVSQSPLALRNADHIVVLDSDGRVTHRGTWDALIEVSDYVQALMEIARRDHDTVISTEAVHVVSSPRSPAAEKTPKPTTAKQPGNEPSEKDRRMGDFGLYKTYANAAGNVLTVSVLLLFAVSAFSFNFPSECAMERFNPIRYELKADGILALLLKWWSSANVESPNKGVAKYLTLYVILCIVALASLTLACWVVLLVMVPRSGQAFHLSVARTALR